MSGETIVAPAPTPRPQQSQPEKDGQQENVQERFDEDDADFVLVVNKKKLHQTQVESQRKQRQSYDYTDDEHHHQNGNHQGRRRKYRDRGGGEQKERGQRRRDKHKNDKENINTNKTASTSTSTTLQPSAQHQTLPTSPIPPQQSMSQPSLPVQRSFSLVVAGGSSSAPQLQIQKGTQTEPAAVAQQQVHPPVLQDQSNDQENVGRLTNRQILMVVKPKESAGPSTTTSSIPDTSSLTSEETLDSIERKTCGDGDSNEGGSSTPSVEFVDAPVPKINPWVANRNAAQVITGSSSGSQVALTGFPSVNEVFVNKQTTQPKQPTQPLQPKQPSAEQLPLSRKVEGKKVVAEEKLVKKSPPSPTSFKEAVSSPKASAPKPPVRELPKKEQLPAMASSQVPPPQTKPVENPASVYVREMTNGFRPGRGRGSYSASASAGRRVPSRSGVLTKLVNNDWPTLGETQTGVEGVRKLSSGEEESEDAVDSQVSPCKSNEDPVQPVVKEDVVDKGHQSKSPSPAPRQQQQQVETTSSSDNEDDGNASGKQRKGSKQRWVPLPLDMTATQGGGQGDYQAQEYKKSGKGKGKYPPSNYHGGYHQRAKGKENVAVNGGNDYSDYPPSHGHQHSRYQSSRGGPHHRSNTLISASRGGGNVPRHRRHANNYHRSNSTLSLNNHSMINGGHTPAHHHANYELIPSPTQPHEFPEYSADFTTLTPMYPAVSEFIMPYVANGYFPTPFTPPAGVMVDPVTDGVPVPQLIIATAPQPDATPQAPFPNGGDLVSVTDLVRTQIEYYFSEQNLTKDVYLRRMMDAQGYLPVAILLDFPRMKQLTQDSTVLISAIQSSETLELKVDMTSVRPKLTPEKWPIIEKTGKIDKGLEKCINNNNTPGGGGGVETLNPNVPEFVPKSKVVL